MNTPLFPLETVLFPGGTLLLQVFEPRYLQMVKYCMQNDTGFGVCLIDDENEPEDKETLVFAVGTYANIYDFEKLDNGMLGVHCHGNWRFRLDDNNLHGNELHYGNIERWLENPCAEHPAVMQSCVEYLQRSAERGELPFQLDAESPVDDPHWISYRLGEILPLTTRSRQTILELDDASLRLKTLYAVVQTLDKSRRPS